MINFWSYKREYKKDKISILTKISRSLESGQIFFGKELKKFEKGFIKKYKSKYGVAVGSGTDALLISLKALGIKPGDQVITAANTAIPTISAIINAGGIPRLVDVGDDYLIDCSKIEREITSKTKAIIPVHLYGQVCNMNEIIRISKKHKIKIIEDCAQSQGAKYKNKFAGTFGVLGCFSFYPTKILGAYGDGGFITTNDYGLYKKIKRIRFYGIETVDKKNKFFNNYYANENGINSRLDEIQSTILNTKLKSINTFINKRRKIAKFYIDNLKKTSLKLPIESFGKKHVYHLFTIYHPKGNKIIKKMMLKNIQLRKIYPFPVHLMKAYKKNIKTKNISLKNTVLKSKGIFCLPLYPDLKVSEMKKIVNSLNQILLKNRW